MSSIFQTVLNGGVIIRDEDGNPVQPIGTTVTNGYSPPEEFIIPEPLTASPNSCSFKITAPQWNALCSELLHLAVTLSPTGTWDQSSIANLATAFQDWFASHTAIDGDPHPQYTTLAEAQALVDALRTQLLGGDVAAALDTFFEVAARITTDESALTALTAAIAGKQAASDALTQIAALNRAKGALIVGSATAWSLLAPSTNGYVLTLDDTEAGGVKWVAMAGGYTLPVATDATLGGVKQGSNVTIDGDGTIHVAAPITSLAWGDISAKPTTIVGYGITDATPSKLISRAYSETATATNITTLIPQDNTIPQDNEGVEVLTAVITPSNAANRIRCSFSGSGHSTGTYPNFCVAMFRSGQADALIAKNIAAQYSGGAVDVTLCTEFVAGGTSAITISIRAGAYYNGGMTLNSYGGGYKELGAAQKSTLIVEEITP